MSAAHPRNDAKAAGMVTPFGDLEVGKMPGSQPEPGRVKVRDENRALGDIEDRRLPICDRRLGSYDGFGFAKLVRATNGFLMFVFGQQTILFQFIQSSDDFPLRC